MRIDLCSSYVFMAKHFLHRTKISAAFYQMCSKAVAKRMRRNNLSYNKRACKKSRNKKNDFTTYISPQFCHAPGRRWRRSPCCAGNAWPWKHNYNTDLYTSRSWIFEKDIGAISSGVQVVNGQWSIVNCEWLVISRKFCPLSIAHWPLTTDHSPKK